CVLSGLDNGDGEGPRWISRRVFIRLDAEAISFAFRDELSGGECLFGCDVVDVAGLVGWSKLRRRRAWSLTVSVNGEENNRADDCQSDESIHLLSVPWCKAVTTVLATRNFN